MEAGSKTDIRNIDKFSICIILGRGSIAYKGVIVEMSHEVLPTLNKSYWCSDGWKTLFYNIPRSKNKNFNGRYDQDTKNN